MSVTFYKIKKWYKMLTGNSLLHVNQDVGKCYSLDDVRGYYNDLTEKVTMSKFKDNELPLSTVESGEQIYFPVGIFQYGLGAYDLYLLSNEDRYLKRALLCANWAVDNQLATGAWDNFSFTYRNNPYSAMAQGEAASLCCRLYQETKNEKFLKCAKKALDFMVLPVEHGGTTKYVGDSIYLVEYTHLPIVLNGWIFAVWGIYDYLKIHENNHFRSIYDRTVETMVKEIQLFDLGYWSKYDLGSIIASPFYHRLHIAQLKMMYKITQIEAFQDVVNKFEYYNSQKYNKCKAFVIKAYQKIIE